MPIAAPPPRPPHCTRPARRLHLRRPARTGDAMPPSSQNLHGSAPDTAAAALLLVDVINPLDFPEADDLLRFAFPAAERLASLKKRARAAGVPIVYANDNFGRWRSDHRVVLERCLERGCKGRPVA